jgi:hypothetical protein
VYVYRRKKVETGQRATSMYWLINKPGLIASALSKVRPERRTLYFMLGQFGRCNQSLMYALPYRIIDTTFAKPILSSLVFPLLLFSMTRHSGQAHTS